MLMVQCDFDDTITIGNVSTLLREAFAPDCWRDMEEEYYSGRYSVEESNIRQFALVKVTKEEIEEFVVAKVVVREGFNEFVDYCHEKGIKLVVVSSGLDLYINPTMNREGLAHLEVYSAEAQVTESGIQVEYTDPSGSLITRGFKESYLRAFKRKGHTVIYLGDGLSDVVPATEGDFVIARSTLERHLRKVRVPCYGFGTFHDVIRHVEDVRRIRPT